MLAQVQPGQQALLVLAHLRKGETFAGLAAGFGIGTATAWPLAAAPPCGAPTPSDLRYWAQPSPSVPR